MSQTSTEQAVREFADAFNARNIEAMVGLAATDCVIVALRSEIEGAFVGHDGVRQWAQGYFEVAPNVQITLERISEYESDRLVVLGRQAGTGQMGGVSFDSPLAILVETEEGLVKRLTAYPSHSKALEAAGLPE